MQWIKAAKTLIAVMEPSKLNLRLSDHRVLSCFAIGKITLKKKSYPGRNLQKGLNCKECFNKVKFIYLTCCPFIHSSSDLLSFLNSNTLITFFNKVHKLCLGDYFLATTCPFGFLLFTECSKIYSAGPSFSHKSRNKSLGWLIFCQICS